MRIQLQDMDTQERKGMDIVVMMIFISSLIGLGDGVLVTGPLSKMITILYYLYFFLAAWIGVK
jgi:hypothetical protein